MEVLFSWFWPPSIRPPSMTSFLVTQEYLVISNCSNICLYTYIWITLYMIWYSSWIYYNTLWCKWLDFHGSIGIKGGLYGKASARQSANYGALRYVIVELNHPEAEMPPWIFLQSTPPVCGVGTYSCPNMSWVGPGVLVRSTCTWKNGHGVTTSRPVPGRWLPWVLYVGSMPAQAMDFRV